MLHLSEVSVGGGGQVKDRRGWLTDKSVTPPSCLLQSGQGVIAACGWPQVGEGRPWVVGLGVGGPWGVGGRQDSSWGVKPGTSDRRFVCDVCGRSYKRRDNLSQHQRTHTGEKPYVCARCGASYSQRWALHYHRLKGCSASQEQLNEGSKSAQWSFQTIYFDLTLVEKKKAEERRASGITATIKWEEMVVLIETQ